MASQYVTSQGDTWDGVAKHVYGDEMQMHVLLEANPVYRTVIIFPAGVTLDCPEVEPSKTASPLPPWKQGAQGTQS